MSKSIMLLVLAACFSLFIGCNTAGPGKYFNIAVLNCNMMHGFAADGLQRELESPSVKMIGSDKDHFEPMSRKEIIDSKIQFIELNLKKLEQLNETDDTKDILQTSLALHQYVLAVYKNEYRRLASLYDEGGPKDDIQSFQRSINNKYYPKFEELFDRLTSAGGLYAARNKIKVNWDVRTSPR